MIKNIKKLSLVCLSLLTLGLISSSTVYGDTGKYDKIDIPTSMPTAFYDALKANGGGLKEDEATDDPTKKTGSSSDNNFEENIKSILTAGNSFGSLGLVYGSHNGGTAAENVRNPLAASSDQIKYLDKLSDNRASQYLKFGQAMDNLVSDAKQKDPTTLTFKDVQEKSIGVANSLGNFGFKLLKEYNPAAIAMALFDSSYLVNEEYKDNKLFGILRSNQDLYDFVTFMGGPSSIYSGASNSFVWFAIGLMSYLCISVFAMFFGGQQTSNRLRRAVAKVFVASIAVPAIVFSYNWGVNLLAKSTKEVASNVETSIAKENLLLSDWYQAVSFNIPSNISLTIKDGKFNLTQTEVHEINRYVMRSMGESDDDKSIVARIKKSAESNKNVTAVNFYEAIDTSGTPWNTSFYYAVADALGSNKKISELKTKPSSISYISAGVLRMNGDTITTINGSDGLRGISPISAYNILRTNFTTNSLAIKSNVNTVTIPSVAIDIANPDKDEVNKIPGFILFILTIILMIEAVKGLGEIAMSALANAGKGTVASSFGFAGGAGTLLGSLLAFLLGVGGIGMILSLSLTATNIAYEVVAGFISSGFDDQAKPIKDAIDQLGFPWNLFSGLFVNSLIANVILLITLPTIAKIPIKGFIAWITALPMTFKAKAEDIERSFVTGYVGSSGGTSESGRAASAAMQNAKQEGSREARDRGQAAKAGMAALGGFMLSSLNNSLNKNEENKEGDNKEGDQNTSDQQSSADHMSESEVTAESLAEEREQKEREQQEQADKDKKDAEQKAKDNPDGPPVEHGNVESVASDGDNGQHGTPEGDPQTPLFGDAPDKSLTKSNESNPAGVNGKETSTSKDSSISTHDSNAGESSISDTSNGFESLNNQSQTSDSVNSSDQVAQDTVSLDEAFGPSGISESPNGISNGGEQQSLNTGESSSSPQDQLDGIFGPSMNTPQNSSIVEGNTSLDHSSIAESNDGSLNRGGDVISNKSSSGQSSNSSGNSSEGLSAFRKAMDSKLGQSVSSKVAQGRDKAVSAGKAAKGLASNMKNNPVGTAKEGAKRTGQLAGKGVKKGVSGLNKVVNGGKTVTAAQAVTGALSAAAAVSGINVGGKFTAMADKAAVLKHGENAKQFSIRGQGRSSDATGRSQANASDYHQSIRQAQEQFRERQVREAQEARKREQQERLQREQNVVDYRNQDDR